MRFALKLPRGSVVFLFFLTTLALVFEQTFALPVLTLMIVFVQQPLLTDEESCALAGILGLLCAVVYHFPFAIGVAACVFAVAIHRTFLQNVHVQAKDALMTVAVCGVFAWQMHLSLNLTSVLRFFVYVAVVIVMLRLWVSRRSYHAQRTKLH